MGPSGEHGTARLRSFHELMRRRVQRILLVSSLYDSFIMSEEGQLHETLLSQFLALNLSHFPDLIRVSSRAEALALLGEDPAFDVVISSIQTGDGSAADLAESLRDAGHELPVIALAYTNRDLADFVAAGGVPRVDRVFLWQGDVRILLAMVKVLEDRMNVENDTLLRGVPAIILVEDSIRFYSSYLPAIYAELFDHTHRLLSEDLNLSQKMTRMRARPKVLLCDHYEEAWELFERYRDHVLGVISDVEFPRGGKLDPGAGLELCRRVKESRPDVRLVLQSTAAHVRAQAEELGASFLVKDSPALLAELRDVLMHRFGFGDFIFRLPDGSEVDRAHDLKSLADKIATVPAESLNYHASRNHFANWLKARTEFALAERMNPSRACEGVELEDLRQHLLDTITESRLDRHRTVIADFERDRFEPSVSFTRIGAGALGGKARGVAFANRILASGIDDAFPEVDISVPPSVVVATQIFDEFLQHPRLWDYAVGDHSEEEITRRFLGAPFPREAGRGLRAFLERVRYPLAVRSSSLLEDSLSQPFAGVYRTFMLPNNHPDLDVRWRQLVDAVKRVYASTFSPRAKTYLGMTSYRLEEEKMAVMVQELVGRSRGGRFYPDFAGVARSHDFYPAPGHAPEDGVVAVALGLGRTVVGGGNCVRFCPRAPKRTLAFSTVEAALEGSQRSFFALDLGRDAGGGRPPITQDASEALRSFPLEDAEADGALTWLGSTWLPEDNRVVDGISRAGVRLVSFAQVLKHGAYPLADLLAELLASCSEGTGAPVEIEFAGNLAATGEAGGGHRFAFLQMRPMALSKAEEDIRLDDLDPGALLCSSSLVMGNGRIDGVRDVVVVDLHRFDRQRTPEIALEVARFDALLRKEGAPYLLVGPGRWGSSDPKLGIPVAWSQISGARAIVESGFLDLRVEPSQGTHFFQNLTSCGVGYFTVNPDAGEGRLDWEWLAGVPSLEESAFVRRLRFDAPLDIRMRGTTGEGAIAKPPGPRP